MRTIKLLIVLLSIAAQSWAQDCAGLSVRVLDDDPDTPQCCWTLELTNPFANRFTNLRLTPISTAEFLNTQLATGWTGNISSTSIEINPFSGFIPTGTFQPITFCIDNYQTAPQQIQLEWVHTTNGDVCSDVINLQCERCMSVGYDQLECAAGGGYDLLFDVISLRYADNIEGITVVPITPGVTANPSFIDLSASPIAPGGSRTGLLTNFTVPPGTNLIDFELVATCNTNCVCTTDRITLEVPNCCVDPCANVSVDLQPQPDEGPCCWTIDLQNDCDPMLFEGIRLDIPADYYFSRQTTSAGSLWQINNFGPQSATWKPRFIAPGYPYIGTGTTSGKINFCISGIDRPQEIPQQITLSWLGANDAVLCDTLLETECEVTVPGSCVIVQTDTIICDENGNYCYDAVLENVGNFTATTITLSDFSTVPAGGTVSFNPVMRSGLTFAVGDTLHISAKVTGLNAGDQFKYRISLNDSTSVITGANNCCHSDILCKVVPECPNDCDPCDISIMINEDPNQPDGYCCYSLDFEIPCDTVIAGVELEVLDGVYFSSASTPISSLWEIIDVNLPSQTRKIWRPRVINPDYPYITSGLKTGLINYCLDGIFDNSQVPQRVVMKWLDINGEVICTDTLTHECERRERGDCIIVVDDTIKCDPPGHYTYCYSIKNNSNWTAEYIKVHDLHSAPAGGVFAPPMQTVAQTFPGGSTIVMPPIVMDGLSPGDSACYVISMYDDVDPDLGFNMCCHTDTLCIVMPECPGDEPCTNLSGDLLPIGNGIDSCCFTLEISNNWSSNSLTGVVLDPLTAGMLIGIIQNTPDWNFTPSGGGGGYRLDYVGAPYIPIGTHLPVEFCLSNYSTSPQRVEIQWIEEGSDGVERLVCCKALDAECAVPPPDNPCLSLIEPEIYCEDDVIKLSFSIQNLANYTINKLSFNVVSPSSGVAINPNPINVGPIAPTQIDGVYTVDVLGAISGSSIHLQLTTHDMQGNISRCCTADDLFCFTVPPCDPTGNPPCESNERIPYEGWVAVNCGVSLYGSVDTSEIVMAVMDIRDHPSAPRNNANWAPPAKLDGNGTWTFNKLGAIFGLATDDQGSVYTSSTSFYSGLNYYGQGGRPSVYKADVATGAVQTLITTQNTSTSESPGPYSYIPSAISSGRAMAFGNIAHNPVNNLLYVANLEDGVIYVLDDNTGAVVGGFDPWNVDSDMPGIVDTESVIAVQYADDRLYFSRSNGTASDEIWSVDLLPNGQIDNLNYRLELQLVNSSRVNITDISLNEDYTSMLLAERGAPHDARVLSADLVGGIWTLNSPYQVGNYSVMTNCAGGSDFTYPDSTLEQCDQYVLASGNALIFQFPTYAYGLQGQPLSGGISQGFIVDYDGDLSSSSIKGALGDVEAFRNCCDTTVAVGGPVQMLRGLLVYPNPTRDYLQVELAYEEPLRVIRLLDLSGRMMIERKLTDDNTSRIDVSGIPSGVYFLQVTAADGARGVKRIVVQNE